VSALHIVKIGGSLARDEARLRALLAGIADGREGPCVVVPGGGPFADAVRDVQLRLRFPDALAHRLALDAMGRMAEILGALEPRLCVETRLGRLRPGTVWDPSALRDGHPGVAESWDVTSDSLALWLAARLDAARCTLVKSADAPPGAEAGRLVRDGLVDAAFPGFAARFPGTIALRGPGRETVLSSVSEAA